MGETTMIVVAICVILITVLARIINNIGGDK